MSDGDQATFGKASHAMENEEVCILYQFVQTCIANVLMFVLVLVNVVESDVITFVQILANVCFLFKLEIFFHTMKDKILK